MQKVNSNSLLKHLLIGLPFLLPSLLFAQNPSPDPIEEVRELEEGQVAHTTGIVTTEKESGAMRFIQDHTGGISLYGENVGELEKGDSIRIEGILDTFNSLLQITEVRDLEIIDRNKPLPEPIELEANQLDQIFKYESQLITLGEWAFNEYGIITPGNHEITKEEDTFHVRFPQNHPQIHNPFPVGPINIAGVISRYHNFYRVIPLQGEITYSKGPGIDSPLKQIDLDENSATFNIASKEPSELIFEFSQKGDNDTLRQAFTREKEINHEIELGELEPGTFYEGRVLLYDDEGDTTKSRKKAFTTASVEEGSIRVFFNRPIYREMPNLASPQVVDSTMADTIVKYLDQAEQTVDAALYNFNNENLTANISQALNNAFQRGVRVRVITCETTASKGTNELHEEIPVLERSNGEERGFMHHKFFLIDGQSDPRQYEPAVITGSMNFTPNQVKEDPNNVIYAQNSTLARSYLEEFNEMWGGSSLELDPENATFGPEKNTNIPRLHKVQGKKIEVLFSPNNGVTGHLNQQINKAQSSLWVGTMLITKEQIANNLIQKSDEGINVNLLLSENEASEEIVSMLSGHFTHGINQHTDPGYFHHKYLVRDPIGDGVVWTGSQNWSRNGEWYNDENTLLIHDSAIAEMFFSEWLKRYEETGGDPEIITQLGEEQYLEKVEGQAQISYALTEGDHFFIETDQPEKFPQTISIALADLNGRTVWEGRTVTHRENGKIHFSLNNNIEGPGTYYIHISGENINIWDWVTIQ